MLPNHLVERRIHLVVLLQFVVHFSNVLLHISDLVLTRLDLPIEIFDLVVQHKLELFQLLVLFLELVNFLFLFSNRLRQIVGGVCIRSHVM